jgi:hypothetical protein
LKYLPPSFVFFVVAIPFLCFGAVRIASTAPVITVLSPANHSQVSSPVHYVASAASPHCAKGIRAMRIYVARHVSSYSVDSSSVDTLMILLPGNHRTVIEASDKCGGISKAEVDVTVSADQL